MYTLLMIHSALRWVIIVVAVLAIINFTIGWAGESIFLSLGRSLGSGFSALMDLQVLTGLVYSFSNGIALTGFSLYRILHMIVMTLAAVVAHLPGRLTGLADKLRFQFSGFCILGWLVLVGIGISILPQASGG